LKSLDRLDRLTFLAGFFMFWVNGDNYAAAPLLVRIASDMGVEVSSAAATVVAYMLCFGLFTLLFGPLGDRFGKSRILAISATGAAVANLVCAASPGLPALVAARALCGALSAGVMPVAMALIGENSPPEKRQARISKAMGLMFLGGALASFIGGIAARFGSWKLVYVVYGVAELGLLVPLIASLPETKRNAATAGLIAPYRAALSAPRFARTVGLLFFVGFSTLGVFAYLGKFLQDRTGYGLATVGAVLSAYGLGTLAGGQAAGRARAALGPRFAAIAALVGAAGLLAFAFGCQSPFIALPALFAAGFGFVCMQSSVVSSAQDLVPERRGTAMSSCSFAMVTSGALGAYANGFIFAYDGRAALALGALSFMAAGLLAAALQKPVRAAADPAAQLGRPGS
jgi:predicted MFS family arabinose efflux permease